MYKLRLSALSLLTITLCVTSAWAQPAPADFVRGRLLVKFNQDVSSEQARGVLAAMQARSGDVLTAIGVHVVELPENANEHAFLNAFRGRREVEFAELDEIHSLEQVSSPNDPMLSSQWQLSKVQASTAWASVTGSGVTVAIVDTGVDGTHPDLAGHMVAGWNIYDNNSDTRDVYGHGTKVAGTTAAVGNNGAGGASVAWNAWIMPMRVSSTTGSASSSAIASGITWAADHGARVANVSYMVSTVSTVISAANYMRSKNGVVTVSAGNYSTLVTDGDVPSILTVSGTDSNDVLYSWSNYGNLIDVAAPGCVSATTLNGGSYGSVCGTSFSAPMVAGVAALVLSKNPALTGDDVIRIIKQAADDIGTVGWDTLYGSGRVNAGRAVSLATSAPVDTQAPTISISWPASGATVSATVTIQVSTGDNVGVTQVIYTLNGGSLGSSSTAPFSYSWNTTGRANGTYTLSATARDAVGNQTSSSINVTINNGDTTLPNITITAPGSGATVSGTSTITVSTSDNVGVTQVTYKLNTTTLGSSGTAPFGYSWNTTTWANGTYTLSATARDAAGNQRTASSTITISNTTSSTTDSTSPVVAITSPASGATVSGNAAVTVNAYDNVGVVNVQLYVNGVLTATSTSSPFTMRWNTRKTSGTQTLVVKAYDARGNVGTSAPVSVVTR
jgi:thermitase